jgi:hypothetical protein
MIESVTITNHLDESIELVLKSPEKSGFAIRSIEGLGPVKADINSKELSTNDGSIFNSARVNSRNIIFDIQFLEKPTIEDTRQLSYKYFPIKRKIKMVFKTKNYECEIYGYVESNEPNIFSQECSTTISILCPDPYFKSLDKNITTFSGILPVFEFEFSNESATDNLLEFGELLNDKLKNVRYDGDAETGVVIYIHAIGDASNITVYNTDTRAQMFINTSRLLEMTGAGIIAGDDIIISTVKGEKSIKLLRNGLYTNILNCLDKNAEWPTISKGDNVFAYTAETGDTNLQFRIENAVLYEGI